MIREGVKYSLQDVTIVPADWSNIRSRSYVSVSDGAGNLPIFTAPMYGLINYDNYKTFNDTGIIPMLPRMTTEESQGDLKKFYEFLYKGAWVAVSLKDFERIFCNFNKKLATPKVETERIYNVCIDTANGNMAVIFDLAAEAKREAKEYNYTINIMAGNIANPETLKCSWDFSGDLIIDYWRIGIGSGSQCSTTPNTGIHYPMASLIDECRKFLDSFEEVCVKTPKLVADGGIRCVSDAIKALGLGADYVMIGTLLAACKESAAEEMPGGVKAFYGMSTKAAQQYYKHGTLKRDEGINSLIPISGAVVEFTNEFKDYLRSAMSYCGAESLKQFRPDFVVNSQRTLELSKR